MLAKIFLALNLFLVGCAGTPLVTVNQLDTVHNKANPFKITKYNEQTCKLELEALPSFPILGPQLHGAYCLTDKDFAKYKAHFQAECKHRNENQAAQ